MHARVGVETILIVYKTIPFHLDDLIYILIKRYHDMLNLFKSDIRY